MTIRIDISTITVAAEAVVGVVAAEDGCAGEDIMPLGDFGD